MKKYINKFLNSYKDMSNAAKASLWFVICGFMQRGISVLTTSIFTRMMSKEQYGVYNTFTSWLEIVGVIVTLRLYNGIYMKGLVSYEDDRDRFTSSLLGLSSLMIVIWLGIYFLFSPVINLRLGLTTPMMICMFVMIITETWFGFWSARQRVDFAYKALIAVTVAASILKPVCGIIAVSLTEDDKAFYRIVSLAIVEFCIYIFLHISQVKRSHVFFDKKYWAIALKFNIVLIPHYLSQRILNHSDRIMIRNFCGDGDAGVYSLAYSIAMIMGLFSTAFLNTLTPWNYQQLKNKNYDGMKKIANTTTIIMALVNIGLILIAPEALTFFAPKSYHEALNVIPPVAMGVFFTFVYGLFVNVEMYYSKNRYVMIASVTGAVLNVALNYVFIQKYGYIAAAYTTLISYIVYCLMHALFVQRIVRKEKLECRIYSNKTLFYVSVLFMACGFALTITYKYPVIRYGIILAVLFVAYLTRNKWIPLIKSLKGLKKKKNEQ